MASDVVIVHREKYSVQDVGVILAVSHDNVNISPGVGSMYNGRMESCTSVKKWIEKVNMKQELETHNEMIGSTFKYGTLRYVSGQTCSEAPSSV